MLYNYTTRGVQAHQEFASALAQGYRNGWLLRAEMSRQAILGYLEILLGGQFVSVADGKIHARPSLGASHTLIPVRTNQLRTGNGAAAGTIFTTDAGKDNVVMIAAILPTLRFPFIM